MRIAWHNEREALYMQAKENLKDKSIKEKLNEGAKKFFADKTMIYSQLEQLRKDWLKTRKDLGEQIKNTK
jgi:CRISPR/Cas system-associated exonuclease Cas4 (RecB family)